jgi:isoleucyl-tRNA synthetase
MLAGGSPWAARRVGHTTIQETVRKVLLTYWNTVAFHVLYANIDGWTPGGDAPAPSERPVLDRWALSEAHRLVGEVTAAMEQFDTQRAGTLLSAYVDDLSNWYVRRSRRRFWDGDVAAFATLHECLLVVTQLMAPMAPFITERVWGDVFAATSSELPESVHLSTWPVQDAALVDPDLADQVRLARRLVELGRAARADAKVRTRQPLRRALVATSAHDRLSEELRGEIAEELNIGSLEPLSAAGADLVDHSAKGNFRALGKRFAKDTPRVAAAIAATDAGELSAALMNDGRATVELDGQPVEVLPDEVIVSERPREGWSVVNEQGETVALDLELTPELRRAGLAREVIRMIQEARKNAGFEVSDRIALSWSVLEQEGSGELAEAIAEHRGLIAGEVLASTIAEADSSEALDQVEPDLGLAFTVYRI